MLPRVPLGMAVLSALHPCLQLKLADHGELHRRGSRTDEEESLVTNEGRHDSAEREPRRYDPEDRRSAAGQSGVFESACAQPPTQRRERAASISENVFERVPQMHCISRCYFIARNALGRS